MEPLLCATVQWLGVYSSVLRPTLELQLMPKPTAHADSTVSVTGFPTSLEKLEKGEMASFKTYSKII